jgi:hypothetical protein
LEISEEKIKHILDVYSKFKEGINTRYLSEDGQSLNAAILTGIYFSKSIDYKQLKDSIRDGIEEARPLNGYHGPL